MTPIDLANSNDLVLLNNPLGPKSATIFSKFNTELFFVVLSMYLLAGAALNLFLNL